MRFIILILLLSATPAVAKNLYVNNSGSPTCSDTLVAHNYANNDADNPWCTFERASWGSNNYSIPVSGEAAQAGDIVIFTAGTYNTTAATGELSEPVLNPVNSGSAGNWIKFTTDGGTVELTASNGGAGEPVIGTESGDRYVWFDGFTVDQTNVMFKAGHGLVSIWGSYTKISNFTLIGATSAGGDQHNGIFLSGATGGGGQLVGIEIYNNDMYGFKATGGADENAAAICFYYTDSADVYNNDIHDSDNGMYIKGGPNGNDIDVYKNLFYNLEYGILPYCAEGGDIYQNVFRDISGGDKAAIVFKGCTTQGPIGFNITNNTIVDSERGVTLHSADPAVWNNNTFKDNLVTNSTYYHIYDMTNNATHIGSDDIDFDYNFYYSAGTSHMIFGESTQKTLTEWKASPFNQDANSVEGTDPLYTGYSTNDFRLCTGVSTPVVGCSGASTALTASQTSGPVGAYITGNEVIGIGASTTATMNAGGNYGYGGN